MADVVLGIDTSPGAPFLASFARSGALAAEDSAAACGAAAAVFRFMNAVSPRANAAIKKTIFHRICMKNLTCMGCGLNDIPGVRNLPHDEGRYGASCYLVRPPDLFPFGRAACAFPAQPTILEQSSASRITTMKTTISLSTPAELETESLVAVVLDHAEPAPNEKEKDKKPQLKVATSDPAVQSVAAELLASGEVVGKPFETNLLHKPAGVKAKRLLLISGGSAKKFSSYDLRRIAGVAVRALKTC